MNSTAKRLYAVIAIVVATYGVSRLVQAKTDTPEVEMPDWTFRQMPLQLANWHGEDTKLDPKIASATGAEVIVNRAYRDEQNHFAVVHTAMFKNPADGVFHSPLNCYRSNGWQNLQEIRENVQVSEDMAITVSLITCEKEAERIMVVYWYQLGDQVLYSRLDLGKLRWTMGGQEKWPALIKVMVQMPITTNSEDTKALLLNFTEHVAKWLNQPEHQKYLNRWPGV
jgi:EpsI family protein